MLIPRPVLEFDTTPLLRFAAEVAGSQQYPAGALYMVATPIGNLADLTLRAAHVLSLADALACEDTRVARRLLHHLGLDKPLIAVHAHNEQAAAHAVIACLEAGQRVAYVSDAGTPAISDPGAGLVAASSERGLRVVPIPGPSSVAAALSVAGAAAGEFRFVGFLSPKGNARRDRLSVLLGDPAALVMLEAPHRIRALLDDLAALAADRRLTLARELTKQFETVVTLAAPAAPDWMAADPNRARGEFVLVLHARAARPDSPGLSAAAEQTLAVLLGELPLKQAVALAARISGAPRNLLYAAALARQSAGGG